MVALKELDEKLLVLQAKIEEEERDWGEEQRKLFEFEDKFLRDTLGEGNMVVGWGESKSAPLRFRNAALRKKKRERQEAMNSGGDSAPATPTLNDEERLKIDLHRFASYSSVTSPAEPIFATLREREQQMAAAPKAKKAKK
ncbi:Cytochrome p450 [Globisporangium polare]